MKQKRRLRKKKKSMDLKMKMIMKVMKVTNTWKISPDNGRIGISAKSGYGKTYLSLALLKKGLQAGYKLYILSYTPQTEAKYWNELKKYGDFKMYEANFKDLNDIIAFFSEVFKDKEGKKMIYINDLDLYLETADSTTISLLKRVFSSIRKVNSIFIYETKSIKGNKYLSLLDNTDILFLGKFGREQETLFKHLGTEEAESSYDKLEDHEFLMIDTTSKEVKIVKVVGDDIVEVPKGIDAEKLNKKSDEDEYY